MDHVTPAQNEEVPTIYPRKNSYLYPIIMIAIPLVIFLTVILFFFINSKGFITNPNNPSSNSNFSNIQSVNEQLQRSLITTNQVANTENSNYTLVSSKFIRRDDLEAGYTNNL